MENTTFSQELYFLIFKYLEGGGCQNAANALREEIARHNLLPKRLDWQGNEHSQDFATFESRNSHISNDFLLKVVSRVGKLLDQHIPSSVQSVNTLLGSGSQSLLRTSSDINHVNESHFLHSRLHHAPLKPSSRKAHPYSQNIVNLITAREASGPSSITSILPTYMYERFARCKRSLGHLACVYCVSFDRTGRFIFTGADDMLIKIWSAEDGRLLATLRGHSSEISDIAVNYENTMLATGSLDKMIRVWCLKTTAPICVLTGHTGMITSLSFCPYTKFDRRYLVSTSNDGSICFWKYLNSEQKFYPEPIKKVERVKQSAHLLCFSFSAGGSFLAVGSSDHYVRVYHMSAEKEPAKILEIQPHHDQVDSLQFSNTGLRFISGSKDGTANIWRYERAEWHSKTLHMSETLPNQPASQTNPDQVAIKLKVTMVGWSLDDRYVITAANDHSIKVWESASGTLKYVLTEHDDEVFVIETHPTDPRIFLSGGHDGKIFLWDLSTGRHIKMFYNQITGQGYGSIFDCKWSPDGSMFACTDSHGHVSIFTFERSDGKYTKVPDEVFFHTDYRPLIRDSNHYVIDEQTQCAPHLMPPPFLVDIDGNPYPPALQRLVPGREHCKDEDQLVPIVAIQNERGVNEILVPQDNNPQQQQQQQQQPSNANPSAPNLNNSFSMNNSFIQPNGDHQQRPTIDDMIERFEQEHARNRVNEEHRYAASGSMSAANNGQPQPARLMPASAAAAAAAVVDQSSSNRPGVRRSGDVEGIRQSTRNYQQRDLNAFNIHNRKYVRPLASDEVKSCYRKLAKCSQLEEETYQVEKQRKPLPTAAVLKELSNKGRVTRRKKQDLIQRRGIRERNSHNANRSVLNNTIEEEAPSYQSDDSDDASFSATAAEWQGSSSSSDNESDSSDTDWELKRNDPRSKRSKRKQSQRLARMNQSESSESDEHAQPSRSSDRLNSRDARGPADENEPSTSAGVAHRPAKSTRKTNAKIKEARNIAPGEIHRPPEWLTEVMPKRAPYFPQMGDELIYFKKGHALYIEAVRNSKAYALPPKIQLLNNRNILDEQPVKVIGISYEIRPPTISTLTLVVLNEQGEQIEKEEHAITYHDMKNVIDFLVPKQFYEQAMRTEWKPNDRFRSIIDNQWWFGTVKAIGEAVTGDGPYKNSNFQNIEVLWDSKDVEKMCAWDLEQCTDRFPESHAQGLSITDDERERLMYQPKPADWPACGREEECDRLIRGLEKIMQQSWAESFNAPVDLNEYPDYGNLITYPIDLSTIKTRLENRFYRSLEAVRFDVTHIERNARDYNQPHSTITRNAKIVTYLVTEFIDRRNLDDPTEIIQMILQNKEMFESTEDDTDVEYRETRGGKKSIRKKNEPAWVAECKQLLSELNRNVDSEPFRTPVDLNEYEDYLEKVSTPMDLGTIREQLLSGNYDDPKDLNKDLKLIFQNSKLYNTDKRSHIYGMTLRLQSLAAEKIKTILNNYKQEQARLESKKGRSNRLTNGKGRKRKLEHNSSAEMLPSTSRTFSRTRNSEQATSSHYTNGHDRPSTSRAGQSSRHEVVDSNDEDYHPSSRLRQVKTENRPMQASGSRSRPRRQVKPMPNYSDNEATDLEEESEEEPFDVTIDEETELEGTTEDDEETEEQSDADDTTRRKSGRLTNGNRQSIKRKKGTKRTRKADKKMKLSNGGSLKGRKASATESSFTDSDATDEAYEESGSKRGRGAASRSNTRNDKYPLRKSKRKTAVNYLEVGEDQFEYEYNARNTVSSRGRQIKMKGSVRAT